MYMRDLDNPAVLFDDVPGFPNGHRVLANIIMSRPRCAIALGLPPESTEDDLIKWWRHYLGDAPNHEPVEVNGGPLVENVTEGEAVNIQSLPSPKWHEHDGGNFIGTGCIVAMRDPDTGWVNYGTYRVQAHEPRVATVMMSPGKHARLLMKKYHDRGEKCPVAVVPACTR
jgi:UbiD family decarboxylase